MSGRATCICHPFRVGNTQVTHRELASGIRSGHTDEELLALFSPEEQDEGRFYIFLERYLDEQDRLAGQQDRPVPTPTAP